MDFNGTFLVTIISFILFVYLMNKVLYEPMRKIVKERNNFVQGNYSSADENNKKAEELVNQRDEQLVTAKDDARKKYNEILNDYKSEKADIISNANNQSVQELEEAYKHLDNVSSEAKERLKGSMADLANDIVEKVLGYRSEVHGFDNSEVDRILYP